MNRFAVAFITLMSLFSVSQPAAPATPPPCARVEADASDEVVLESRDREGRAVEVAAHLRKPEGGGPFPAVVLLHATGGFQSGYLCIADRFVEWGYAALAIDSNSSQSRNRYYSFGSFLASEQGEDAHAGRRFLSTLPYVDRDRLAVIGWSAGGDATLSAISANKVFWNGNWHGVERDGAFAAAVTLYPYCGDHLEDLETPLLVLIGANDDNASARHCQRIAEQTKSDLEIEIRVYPNAEHGFDGPWVGWTRKSEAAADAKLRIQEFLEKHLP